MSEQELQRRAKEIEEQPTWCLFWPGGLFYGQGKWLKKFSFYPQWLPLPVWTDHSGPDLYDSVLDYEKNIKAPHALKMSPRNGKQLCQANYIPCDTILAPHVYYRWHQKIRRSDDAKGTVVFPAHSVSTTDKKFDENTYINMLLELPEKYHPITICMFYFDILKKRHREYAKHFPVVTCGHREDCKFMERLYNVISQHRYVLSNALGSQLFYAVECGIPFIFYGPQTKTINKNNKNFDKGELNRDSVKIIQRTKDLFSVWVDEPTDQQVDFVEKELGVKDSISRLRAACILYKSLMQFLWWKVKRKLFEPKKQDDLPPLLSSRR